MCFNKIIKFLIKLVKSPSSSFYKHFFFTRYGWDTKDYYERTHKSDLIKNKYCFDNKIPLIRIPYNADYTLNDLKLETTRFLLTPENEKEYYENRS